VGAGRDLTQARQPVTIPLRGARAVIFACGAASSGIPPRWAATAGRPGVDLLPSLSGAAANDLLARMRAARQPSDIVVVSLHWGSNWGYGVTDDQVRFAHRLIDAGAGVIHGHSSHHPRPVEVYRGRLVLYGCGDAINDYEGISGYQQLRPDLRLLYFASVAADTGALAALRIAPMQARQMRQCRASTEDTRWLRAVLERISHRFGSPITPQPDGTFVLHPPAGHHPR
jgi:poly-gamma-glutamate capsule biosynthesis protein CapA/YwtB (metallophosphatase superfamily)